MTDNIKELTITRIFDAPRELVWKYWTDPKLLSKWWGPRGVTNPVCEVDPRPQGNIYIVMLAGEELGELKGQEWPMKGSFIEVKKPEKIIYTSTAIEDEDGTPNLENIVTIKFESEGDKTKMTLHILVTKATDKAEGALRGMQMGWTQSIDKLAEQFAIN